MSHVDPGAIQLKVTSQQSINAMHVKAREYAIVKQRTAARKSCAERIYTAVNHGLMKIIEEPIRYDTLQAYLAAGQDTPPLTPLEIETTMKLIREIVLPLMEQDSTPPSSA